MAKIVYLDSHTLNPGDLSWQALENLGDFKAYPRSIAEEIIERSQEASIILTNKVRFQADLIQKLPNLRYISVTATGYDIIDLAACQERNILVSNVPAYGTESVAQHTWALILAFSNRLFESFQSVKAGEWSQAPDWTYWTKPLRSLQAKTLGIFGMGAIGQAVAKIARAFGMRVVYYSPRPKNIDYAQALSLEDLFRQSDVLTLHAPLNESTQHIIRQETLSYMKKEAILINTSRGGLIQEEDLKEALEAQRIGGAALDVLSQEPPPSHHPLIGLDNCLISPHNAWASFEARETLLNITVQNVRAFLASSPQNLVNSKR